MTPIRMAQYGTRHGHADGKLAALRAMRRTSSWSASSSRTPRVERRSTAPALPTTACDGCAMPRRSSTTRRSSRSPRRAGTTRASSRRRRSCAPASTSGTTSRPATTGRDGREVVAEARARDLRIQVGYMFRYHEGFSQIGEWVRSGLLGDVFAIRAHMSTSIPLAARQRHRPPPRRHLLRPGRPHARSDRLDAGPSRRSDGLSPAGRGRRARLRRQHARRPRPIRARWRASTSRRWNRRRWRGDSRCTGAGAARSWSRSSRPVRSGSASSRPSASVRPASSGSLCVQQTRQELYELELRGLRGRAPRSAVLDRSLDHELLVQETLLRATGRIPA